MELFIRIDFDIIWDCKGRDLMMRPLYEGGNKVKVFNFNPEVRFYGLCLMEPDMEIKGSKPNSVVFKVCKSLFS